MNSKLALLPLVLTSLSFGMNPTPKKVTIAKTPILYKEAALLDYFRKIFTAEEATKALRAGLPLPRGILNYVMRQSRYRPELITVYRQYGADPMQTDCDNATNDSYHRVARDLAGKNWNSRDSLATNFYGPQLPIQALAHYADRHPVLITCRPRYKALDEEIEKYELLIENLSDAQKKVMFEHGTDIGMDVRSILQQPIPNDQRNSLLKRVNAFYDRLAAEQTKK